MVSVRRVVPVLLLAVVIPIFGAPKKSSSRPPRDLHRVGDHWTAYNPADPSTWPAGSRTYTVKSGDTLWGLAQQFFKNPYTWPQLWEGNTWITDAHWIYPGDVLLIDSETAQQVAATASSAHGETMPPPPPLTPDSAVTASSGSTAGSGTTAGTGSGDGFVTAADAAGGSRSPVPLATEADVYCYGYIGDDAEPMPNTIQGYEDSEMRYQKGNLEQAISGASGDLVIINGGTGSGVVAGDTYILVENGGLVTHPDKRGQVLGRQYLYRGQVRILCADDRHARGLITQSCAEIHIGARLKPLPQIPIPLARIPDMPAFCDPSSAKRNGYIVGAQGGWDTALGEGLLVEVNLGQSDQIQPGDFLTVYREDVAPGQPRQVLGEVGILTTNTHTATGKIVAMRYSMKIGDRVEIR
ncbi:MAG: LysM peptidoglycan-binding domain-containing protein [Acidobacteriota bacterium]|nr:LysM peptidoglycan-binding domain-containing protein [Acidobacteriota bacterium]